MIMKKKKIYVAPSAYTFVARVDDFCVSTGTSDVFADYYFFEEEEEEEEEDVIILPKVKSPWTE